MRAALYLSGVVRKLIESSDDIIKNIIIPNNCDVFIHTWDIKTTSFGIHRRQENSEVIFDTDKLKAIYNPKSIIVDDLSVCKIDYQFTTPSILPLSIDNFQYMCYSLNECNNLRKLSNIKYDYCIRSRFDLNITKSINVSSLDASKFNAIKKDHCNIFPYASDNFFITSPKNMDYVCDLYNNIRKLYSSNIPYNPEIMLTVYVMKKMPIVFNDFGIYV